MLTHFGKTVQRFTRHTQSLGRCFTMQTPQLRRFTVAPTTNTKFPPHLLNLPPTKVTTLPNKLRVASEEIHGETATIGVFVDAGSIYEDDSNNGVAHYLEHMAFKGTAKRTREALEIEVENMGGQLNAYTSREHTVFYAKVFKNDVPKAVDILADILQNSTYDKKHIEAERSTILREMEEVGKQMNEVVFDHLHAAAYQGTPLARTILGPEENIKKITRDDLINYVKTHYQAPRIVVAGAGAFKHEQLVELATKAFSGLPTSNSVPKTFPTSYTGSQILIRDDTVDTVHMTLAVEAVGWSHPDQYTFQIMQQLLGSWDRSIGGGKNLSSRLCEIFATEELAHSLSSFNTCYNDSSLFGVYITAGKERIDDAVYETFNELNRIGKFVTPSEVERAKNKLKASILMQMDGTTAVAEDIGRQLLTHGRRLSPAEIFARIDDISVKDVMRVASQYCEDVSPAVVAIGPLEHMPDYNQIRGWTYWNRW